MFYESLNFAALQKLPIIYVCENNLYAVQSHISARQALPENLHARSEIFGIPGLKVDGNDVEAVYAAARGCFDRARAGGGPSLLEAMTYRWHEHVGPGYDTDWGWRPKREFEKWKARDPVATFAARLLARRVLSPASVRKMARRIDREVEDAFVFAKRSPLPAARELLKSVY